MINPLEWKEKSEAAILHAGGRVLSTLPCIDVDELRIRPIADVTKRALVLNVLVHLSFGAPPAVALQWISSNNLLGSVVDWELPLLQSTVPMSEESRNRLRWHIEPLWAIAWAGSFIDDLGPLQAIEDTLAAFFPDLRSNESPDLFLSRFRMRTLEDVFPKLDHFYRAHWYTRDCQLNGKDPSPFNPGVVQSRRHLLEWLTHSDKEWNDVDMST